MSPRQRLRAYEVRAPDDLNDQLTDRQVRQYPDRPGRQGRDLQDHLGATASRIRLNAGSLDWRQGGAGGTGPGGKPLAQVTGEQPDGDRDGLNLVFRTASPFVPQTLQLWLNGLRSTLGASADFTIEESGGTGSGYDSVRVAWAPLPSDQLLVDYWKADSAQT